MELETLEQAQKELVNRVRSTLSISEEEAQSLVHWYVEEFKLLTHKWGKSERKNYSLQTIEMFVFNILIEELYRLDEGITYIGKNQDGSLYLHWNEEL